MLKNAVVVACAALLTLTACGGKSDDQTAKDNLEQKMLEGSDSLGTKATKSEATCIANGIVDDLGIDKLKKYGFLTDDLRVSDKAGSTPLTASDAHTFAHVYVTCIDMKQLLTERQPGADKFTTAQKACIVKNLDTNVLEDGLAAVFQGQQDKKYVAMQRRIEACTGGPAGASSSPSQ
jgi:hypothetical protein